MDHPTSNYQRLEFLGDSALQLAVSHALYAQHPKATEGDLSKKRGVVVSRRALTIIAHDLGLADDVLAAPDVRRVMVNPDSHTPILGCVLEAVVGALLLDHGFPACQSFVNRLILPHVTRFVKESRDYIGELQEFLAKRRMLVPDYVVLSENPHDPPRRFQVACVVMGQRVAIGFGQTRQLAKAAPQEPPTKRGVRGLRNDLERGVSDGVHLRAPFFVCVLNTWYYPRLSFSRYPR